uniref:WRKY19-like zinc finger domain-containing protein n=1 Tax=Hyaloperonospora arabidopsidis (strain Emoy2) TaxID=559515 RepID=M4B2N6_HYAAE
MTDSCLRSPDSPVDSAMFPPVYNRSLSSSSSSSLSSRTSMSFETPNNHNLPYPDNRNVLITMTSSTSLKHELEPFEFRAPSAAIPTPRSQAGTSLSSVFGDQDLVDAIMCSLNAEQYNNNNNAAKAASSSTFSLNFPTPRRLQQQLNQLPRPQSFTALMHQQRPLGSLSSMTSTGPCIRKPGTFLNKDGRWIKGKPCRMDSCDKRAQSNGLCKGHGGGARCSFSGCSKSSQGGGFCRAHGGGKRCMYEGCEKGTQRNGFCYLHGGVRSCSVEGCDKKDRGNGKCFSHGGGRKCQAHMCFSTIRRGAFCDLHNEKHVK